jgi:outer membrane protein TolC
MTHIRPLHRPLRAIALAASALVLSGCASLHTPPEPLNAQTLNTAADRQALRLGVDPIAGPLTLDEALARALKFNAERRARMMEEALALGQFDAARFDMLPKLVAQAGYSWRDNDRTSLSRNPVTGDVSGIGFISSEREHANQGLELSWSLLDLGMGYYGARQQAHRLLIATEKRRKAMHLLMQDVRTAFWRAASAQLLRNDVVKTIAMAEEALADSRKAEFERVRNPLDALRYQRQLLENLRLLESINQELSAAQVELASLINAPVGQPIVIAEGAVSNVGAQALEVPVQKLEELALLQNPDLREQGYNSRIAREEVRRTMVRMFPNLNFNYGIKYDSDRYLVNSNWHEAGLQLSFNLFNLATGPAQIKLAEAGVALADQRRVASHMAVVTQVHLARLNLANARSQFERADAIQLTDSKIAEMSRNRQAAQALSKLDVVSNETAAILSLLRRYQALAQVQTAENRLLATLGLEPKIGSTSELGLKELTEQLRRSPPNWSSLWTRPAARSEAEPGADRLAQLVPAPTLSTTAAARK